MLHIHEVGYTYQLPRADIQRMVGLKQINKVCLTPIVQVTAFIDKTGAETWAESKSLDTLASVWQYVADIDEMGNIHGLGLIMRHHIDGAMRQINIIEFKKMPNYTHDVVAGHKFSVLCWPCLIGL